MPVPEQEATHVDARPRTLSLSRAARNVFEARHLRRDAQRNVIETPEQLFDRLAGAVAQAEVRFGQSANVAFWREEFRTLLASLSFLPNSPTLMNARSISDSARRPITMITLPDVIRMSEKYDA
jgi:ribonucleoside-diphosphate reductase alpha chain